jgi:hypothetical protein
LYKRYLFLEYELSLILPLLPFYLYVHGGKSIWLWGKFCLREVNKVKSQRVMMWDLPTLCTKEVNFHRPPATNYVDYGLDCHVNPANKPSKTIKCWYEHIRWVFQYFTFCLTFCEPRLIVVSHKIKGRKMIVFTVKSHLRAASNVHTNQSNESCDVFVVDCCVLHLRCALSVMMTQPHQQNGLVDTDDVPFLKLLHSTRCG